jgi:hypothetical protein
VTTNWFFADCSLLEERKPYWSNCKTP